MPQNKSSKAGSQLENIYELRIYDEILVIFSLQERESKD